MSLHIIILAAGNGTRMRTKVPKVLHHLGGRPLLEHVIKTAEKLLPKKIHVIYGGDGDIIRNHFVGRNNINWIEQQERLGTGHAVIQALAYLEHASQVLILYGDVPLITVDTLQELLAKMPEAGLCLLSTELTDPTGFGRIMRDKQGAITAIIEHREATSDQKKVREINTGVLATTSQILRNYLPRLKKQNAQGEYYLTDIIAMLYTDDFPIYCLQTTNPMEVTGINDKKQLASLERQYQKELADDFMLQGLTLMDPNRFDVRGDLNFGDNVIIDVNVIVEGRVTIGSNTTIGPNNFLKNVQVGNNVIIKPNCVIEDATISDNCIVGPFARIRPNTYLAEGAHVGNFVEVKNTKIGKNSKANHLSYLGDSIIGDKVNVGAGTITCNYDGINKHQTTVEDSVFIGSNTTLVAPVKLGENSYVGAGSVITQNTPKNQLTIARSRQVTIESWQKKK